MVIAFFYICDLYFNCVLCWNIGKKMFYGWNKIAEENGINAKMTGYPIRMDLKCYDNRNMESISMKSLILQEVVKRGIFMSILGASYISYSHSMQDIENTLKVFDDTCKFISKNVIDNNYEKLLEGELPKTIWSMKIPPTKKHE